MTAKTAYHAIVHNSTSTIHKWWYKTIWQWMLRLKIKCFMWMALQNCLKTWDNLVKKGWYGPSLCILCKDSKSVDHMLASCSFTIEIWKKNCLVLKISQVWEGENFDDCVF